VAVLDFAKLDEGASDLPPFEYAKGVEHVIVNGTPVITPSEHSGTRPGHNLLRS
jgi:hypothetical protein